VALQLTFGDATPLLASLAGAAVDAVGIDFCATPLDALPVDFPKAVLAGVVDATSSRLEQRDELAELVRELRSRRPAGLVLTPNGDLEHVPETIATRKLQLLGAAARERG
jgi:methionine synthase II (cobalamin-independent)